MILSRREEQVASMLMQGLANKAIAYNLQISTKTVESHRARVMEKTESKSFAGFVISRIPTRKTQGLPDYTPRPIYC